MVDEVTQECTTCFRVLVLDRFEWRADRGHRRKQCKDCRAAYFRKWRKKNPELSLQISRDSYHRLKAETAETRKLLRVTYYGQKPTANKSRARFAGQGR